VKFAFIQAEKAFYPLRVLCRVLNVSPSGYYAWTRRMPSMRAARDASLATSIVSIHGDSRGTYGCPRIHAELRAQGVQVSRKRIARLMRTHGVVARLPRRFKRTTDSAHAQPAAENVLNRGFTVDAPNTAWVTDITYVWTGEGWLYLAVILDLFSRRVVGWSMADHMRTELVAGALRMALGQRALSLPLLHHSDRGSQYASAVYRRLLSRNGITCSMSRRANCWDNAVAESFFATLKAELIHRHRWPTRAAARTAIAEYIEVFYNRMRRHSSLGYTNPAAYEKAFQAARRAAA
jgi:putative transposase